MTQLSNFDVQHVEGGKPIKLWTRGVPVDEKAHEQLRKWPGGTRPEIAVQWRKSHARKRSISVGFCSKRTASGSGMPSR